MLDGVPEFETVTRGFVDVARMGREGSNRHDKRASAIEVAADHDVELKGNGLLAILPKQYLEGDSGRNDELLDRLAELGIPFRTYDWRPNSSPDEFQADIAAVARAWFATEGWL